MIIDENNDVLIVSMLCLMLVCIAAGCYLFVCAETIHGGFSRLLCEEEFSSEEKKKAKRSAAVTEPFSLVYWLLTTAIFLAVGFSTDQWNRVSLIWPIAGVLFPAVLYIFRAWYFRSHQKPS